MSQAGVSDNVINGCESVPNDRWQLRDNCTLTDERCLRGLSKTDEADKCDTKEGVFLRPPVLVG